jgi:hypothetical protein
VATSSFPNISVVFIYKKYIKTGGKRAHFYLFFLSSVPIYLSHSFVYSVLFSHFTFLTYFFHSSIFSSLPSSDSISHILSLSFTKWLCFFYTSSFGFWHHPFTTSFSGFSLVSLISSSLWRRNIVGHSNRPAFLYRLTPRHAFLHTDMHSGYIYNVTIVTLTHSATELYDTAWHRESLRAPVGNVNIVYSNFHHLTRQVL